MGRFQAKRKRTYARDNENLSMLYHGNMSIFSDSITIIRNFEKLSEAVTTYSYEETIGIHLRVSLSPGCSKIHSYTCHCLPLEAIQSFPYFCLNWIESNWAFSRGFPSLGAAPILPFDIKRKTCFLFKLSSSFRFKLGVPCYHGDWTKTHTVLKENGKR